MPLRRIAISRPAEEVTDTVVCSLVVGRARPELEHLLGHRVFLELKVRVRTTWRRATATLERLGS